MSCCCTSTNEVQKIRYFFSINDLLILGGKNSSLGGVKKSLQALLLGRFYIIDGPYFHLLRFTNRAILGTSNLQKSACS